MHLARIVSLALLLMTVLVTGTVFYNRGSVEPNKLQQLGFDVCNGKPCFMGIKLGTPWADAREILVKKKELIGLTTDIPIVLRVQNIDIAVRPDNSQTYVNAIDFITWPDNDPKIPMSSMIATFGNPCGVTIGLIDSQMVEWIAINYPGIHFNSTGISVDSTIHSLVLSKDSDLTDCASKKVEDLRSNPWSGFRGLPYYMIDRTPQ